VGLAHGSASRAAGTRTVAVRAKKFEPVQKHYNVGTSRRVIVTRNAKGKVTLAFPQGLKGLEKGEVLAAVEQIVKDLG
jgi:hypothetical protein